MVSLSISANSLPRIGVLLLYSELQIFWMMRAHNLIKMIKQQKCVRKGQIMKLKRTYIMYSIPSEGKF